MVMEYITTVVPENLAVFIVVAEKHHGNQRIRQWEGGKMISKNASRVDLVEKPNALHATDVAHAKYVPEILLIFEATKRTKLAKLEMDRLTQQAVQALERLT
jgi:hypothetical protein